MKPIFNPLHSEEMQMYPSATEFDTRFVLKSGDTMTGDLILFNNVLHTLNYSMTVPATGTVALLGIANVFTTTQQITLGADVKALILKANATQNNFMVDIQNSSGSSMFVIDKLGGLSLGINGTNTTIVKVGNTVGDEFFVGTTGAFRVQRAGSNSEAFRVQINGDTQGRWLGTSDGKLRWGPGNVTQDTYLHRSAASTLLLSSDGTATGVGNLIVTGAITANEAGDANSDFRVEGDTDANLLFIDAGADKVGIGDSAPGEKLDVAGNINSTGVLKIDDVQVVSNRVIDARIDDTPNSGDATTDGIIAAIQSVLLTHGLAAAA